MGEAPGPETLAEAERCLDPEGTGMITWEKFQEWFFSESSTPGITDEPVEPIPYVPDDYGSYDEAGTACYTCECKEGFVSDPADRTKCSASDHPTAAPTAIPTSQAPTTAPTLEYDILVGMDADRLE